MIDIQLQLNTYSSEQTTKMQHTSRAASMLNLRKSASVPVTVEPPLPAAAFFFTTALDTGAFGGALA